jgi:phenylalanyl-tRNA synthetase beta chain
MKFSENWLRELVGFTATRAELTHRLTMCGLEVESVEALGAGLEDVRIGEILTAEQHPNADRLRVCTVSVGSGEPLSIVCGAPNARVGLKAPVAVVGAKLPGGLEINAAKLRGVESFGMLCSGKELGLDSDANGLLELPADAPVGQGFASWLGLPDSIIELGLTPNRSDCLGMRGLAMEVAAEFAGELKIPQIPAVAPAHDQTLSITLTPGTGCPRYCGRVLEGLAAQAPTPRWMQERLRRAGLRSISALVDVTNYVMLETGQPLHAFDADKIAGGIQVRRARSQESCTLLDGREVTLDPEFLVIADDAGAVALAGVMGGYGSRITESTQRVFLEAAHFSGLAIAGRARKLGMHTDASHRFERGVDPELPRLAVERATALLLEIAGGNAGPISEAVLAEELPVRAAVPLRRARIARVLGIAVPDVDVERILHALGMQVATTANGWSVRGPSWRFDIEIEEDLIEEVARIYGYDHIPTVAPRGEIVVTPVSETRLPLQRLRERLLSRDYSEAVNLAFSSREQLAQWGMEAGGLSLANPLSADLAMMRTSLLPGLIVSLQRNQNRQRERVRLFEIGRSYRANGIDAPIEEDTLALVLTGDKAHEQWGVTNCSVDFFDLKGDIEDVLAGAVQGARVSFAPGGPAWMHPGRSASLQIDGVDSGSFGALHPELAQRLGLDGEVLVAELSLDAVRSRNVPKATDISRFPSVRRDLALILAESVAYESLEAVVRAAGGTLLRELSLFDVYRGAGIETGCKSFAIGLIFQDDSRTLGDAVVDQIVAAVIEQAAARLGAQVRS